MRTADEMPIEPWGKLDRGDSRRRLTLVGHCIDVAAVFTILIGLPTMKRRLERLAGRRLDDLDVQRLAVIAFMHDAGKAGAGFYSKGESAEVRSEWLLRSSANVAQSGHTHVVAPLLTSPDYGAYSEALGLDVWADWWDNGRELWLAAVSHHGQPITADSLSPSAVWPTWTCAIAGYRPLHGLRRLHDAARRLWPEAFTASPSEALDDRFTHGFAGLVSLADWIGSNTEHFPYELAAQDEERWPHALQAAQDAVKSIGLDLSCQQASLRDRRPTFGKLFDFEPNAIQEGAATRLEQPLVVLEAETGGGKTEAALWRFARLFAAGEVDALCFLLPTRVAASGIYERLEKFVRRAFPDPETCPSWVLAVPGDLRANGVRGERQPGLAFASVLWPDADVPESRFWAAENSKRYFAAGLAAGTIDQFLLSSLSTGHAHLRAVLSLRSLVVVDEVHASDPYMTRLLRAALARHLSAGGHAMLLSATLTGAARSRLIVDKSVDALARPAAPYPCLSHSAGIDEIRSRRNEEVPSKRLVVTAEDAMRDPSQVAALALTAADRGQRVLVLRNTVAQALATQRALEALAGNDHPALFRVAARPVLHHGRYARADRLLLDRAVAMRFGKEAAESLEPAILVGTQTLEISVDCDADLLITDLAPMDVLLQRLGRLHRHSKRHPIRPGGSSLARAIVLTLASRDLSPLLRKGGARGLGLGPHSAYPNLLAIEACWRAIERREIWEIPHDNRALVETCCDEATLGCMAAEMGSDWLSHMNELTGKALAQRNTAEIVMMDWLQPWSTLAPGELTGNARTRLGLDALTLELPEPWVTPLGQMLKTVDVPAWMLGAVADLPTANLTGAASADELCFDAGGRSFRYSRLGLERLS
jgi:CRISPR-associated endonuclease/helicase Cas3